MDSQGPSSHFNERARYMRPMTTTTGAELPPSSPLPLAMHAPYHQQPYQTSSTQGWEMTGNPSAPLMATEGRCQALQNPPQLRVEAFDSALVWGK